MYREYKNLDLQKIATESLRNGLIAYDRRKGWRGPITNIKYNDIHTILHGYIQ